MLQCDIRRWCSRERKGKKRRKQNTHKKSQILFRCFCVLFLLSTVSEWIQGKASALYKLGRLVGDIKVTLPTTTRNFFFIPTRNIFWKDMHGMIKRIRNCIHHAQNYLFSRVFLDAIAVWVGALVWLSVGEIKVADFWYLFCKIWGNPVILEYSNCEVGWVQGHRVYDSVTREGLER